MIPVQSLRTSALSGPATAATNAVTAVVLDTLGAGHAQFFVVTPKATASNSSAKLAVLAVTEADTTSTSDATAFANLTGTTNATASSSQFVLPVNNNTSNGQIVQIDVPLPGRKRYLHLSAQPAASHATLTIIGSLSRLAEAPDSDSERGTNLTRVTVA